MKGRQKEGFTISIKFRTFLGRLTSFIVALLSRTAVVDDGVDAKNGDITTPSVLFLLLLSCFVCV